MGRARRAQSKFTHAQREACYRLTLQPGMNQHRAAEIFRTVGFERLPPFSISPASVYRISREIRATRAPDGTELALTDPADAVDHLIRDAIKLVQRQLARLETLEAQGKLTPKLMRDWLSVLRELRTQAGKVRPRAPKPSSEADAGRWSTRPDTDNDGIGWLTEDEANPGDTSVTQRTDNGSTAESHETNDSEDASEASNADSAEREPIPIEDNDVPEPMPSHMA